MDIVPTSTDQQPTRQALAIEGRSGRLKVTGKLKAALNAMAWEGKTRDAAAEAAGLSIHGLREALKKPHVKAYYKEQVQVLRESEHARNIIRLTQIRDAADNMPAVQAIKMLEQLGDDDQRGAAGAGHSPGLTIRIINHAPQPPTIDVTPTQDEP